MYWLSESEIVVKDKVYHITNPEWIKNLIKILDKKYDNDTSKNQEASKPS